MIRHLHCAFYMLIALWALPGCGDGGPRVVPVTGSVTRNGKPVANLFINFIPDAGRPSWGQSDEQGQFTLEYDRDRKGAEVGKHKVSVKFRPANPKEEMELLAGRRKFHPDQKAIEAKYGIATSTLEIEIKSSGQPVTLQLD
jgi:hypothetical protein